MGGVVARGESLGALALLDAVARELMLFAGVGLLIGGLDDLLLDLLFVIRRASGATHVRLSSGDLPAIPASRFAIFVPTWREAAVIGPMLSTLLDRLTGEFTVYVAAYANDAETIAAIEQAATADGRVQLVRNPRPGPTTKADNLNALWTAMLARDGRLGTSTRAVVLHDAEDVVHVDELRVFDALIDRFDVIQLPVHPLARQGVQLIAGTYGDSFAESHAKAMTVRAAVGAGMPLAGVGCAIATDALHVVANTRGGLPFDAASVVEDYEAGLRLAELRFRAAFVRHRGAAGLVAIGEYFPDTFGAAVRQKARWMSGIALAGWDRTGWSRPSHLLDHWFRARDRRALLAMIVLAAAYAAMVLFAAVVVAHDWTGVPPSTSVTPPAWLLGTNVALLGWRMAMRVLFCWRAYGAKTAVGAPLRFIVGNFIDLSASVLALRHYVRSLKGAAPHWDKTEHQFPDLSVRQAS